jgi:hypothetical protein
MRRLPANVHYTLVSVANRWQHQPAPRWRHCYAHLSIPDSGLARPPHQQTATGSFRLDHPAATIIRRYLEPCSPVVSRFSRCCLAAVPCHSLLLP